MTLHPTARAILLLTTLVALTGCSRSSFNADVSGKVTLDGRPIGPGVVTFAPADFNQNPSVGAIDASGNYFLKTKHERGIDAGKYSVSVQVYKPEEKLPPGQRSTQKPESLAPEKYLRVDTSGLSFQVEPGSQTIDLKLESD